MHVLYNNKIDNKCIYICLFPQARYVNDDATHKFLRRQTTLRFLPGEHIAPVFGHLRRKATTDALQSMCSYIADTWINRTVWPPALWTVYRQSIRTNTDTEGWHRHINNRSRAGLDFYLILQLLHNEAVNVSVQVRLVSERKKERPQRHQRKIYKRAQKLYFEYWDHYDAGDKTPSQLLRACAMLNGPVITLV